MGGHDILGWVGEGTSSVKAEVGSGLDGDREAGWVRRWREH